MKMKKKKEILALLWFGLLVAADRPTVPAYKRSFVTAAYTITICLIPLCSTPFFYTITEGASNQSKFIDFISQLSHQVSSFKFDRYWRQSLFPLQRMAARCHKSSNIHSSRLSILLSSQIFP